MSLNGVLREALLVPMARRKAADILSAVSGIVIVLGVSRRFLRGADPSETSPGRVAGSWLVLTVAFEFLVGHYVDRKRWSELAANYAIWRGRLWPLVLLTVVIAPFLWMRRRA
jgi:hypothetical protein